MAFCASSSGRLDRGVACAMVPDHQDLQFFSSIMDLQYSVKQRGYFHRLGKYCCWWTRLFVCPVQSLSRAYIGLRAPPEI